MKNMTLENIAEACNGTYYGAEEQKSVIVEGVVLDSRKVKQNYLFIATRGERTDGHSFIGQVYEAGAACVICEEPQEKKDKPYILVNNSFTALRQIAEFYRMQLSIKVVGITGSVGKTSTKEFIAGVLSQKYRVLKTEGNFNNEIGLPLTVLQITQEHEAAVLEMGINHFGEMDRLAKIAKPDICVMTNIGQCHLEFLGSRQGILKAKSEMLEHMKEEGTLCINGDDDMLATIKEVHGKKPVTFGLLDTNDIYARNIITKGLFGTICDICDKKQEFKAEIPLPGEHMVYNALAAAAVGRELGITEEEIAAGIKAVPSVSGRSNLIVLKDKTLLDDCYNANPVSMQSAIDLLTLSDTRKVAILGDMGELGKNEKEMHAQIGKYAAEAKIDVLICIGKRSQDMAKAAKKEAAKENTDVIVFYFPTVDTAKEQFSTILKEKDTILIKASHFMGFDQIVKALSE